MTIRDAALWDNWFQPTIVGMRERADRLWSWVALRSMCPLIQLRKGYRCRALTIKVANAQGTAVPAGMLMLIEHYPDVIPPARTGASGSEFIWFITSAPDGELRRRGVGAPPVLGEILIDIALICSVGNGCEGRSWLHCAPAGGQKLFDFYQRKVGLSQVPPALALPVPRTNDGRFFYSDEALATGLIATLSGLR